MTIRCRACGKQLVSVVDLGAQPAGGHFPRPGEPDDEPLPLRLGMCGTCGLAQLVDPSPPERDDPDAPSPLSSTTMSAHANAFVDDVVARGAATPSSRVLSVASHGGHLGPFLVDRAASVTILEASSARAASLTDVPAGVVVGELDGEDLSQGLTPGSFDLVVDSYLLAHLARPRVAIRRLARLLAPGGILALEFDYLLATVQGGQWDAIRHGHQSYLALGWVSRELRDAGLDVVDAVAQPVYGGALRIYAQAGAEAGHAVVGLLARETAAGIDRPEGLAPLGDAVERGRRDVVGHLEAARAANRLVVGYGAPARSVTFLNALGIGTDLLPYVVDRAAAKQGRLIPGVHVPIRSPDVLTDPVPDEILILTWDLAREVRSSLALPVLAGTRFSVAMPDFADVTDIDAMPPAS